VRNSAGAQMLAKYLHVLDLLIRDADGPPKQTGATYLRNGATGAIHLRSVATECSAVRIRLIVSQGPVRNPEEGGLTYVFYPI